MLSIIIPTLNEEEYLPLLLKEIKKQNISRDYEIIVADAGSQDKTIEIGKSFGCKIVPGGIPGKGRNEGAKVAQGETFLFVDADVLFLPQNFLKDLLRKFEERNLDIASFSVYAEGDNKLDRLAYGIYNFWTNLTQKFLPHATHSFLVRRKLHKKIGGFDEDIMLAEDHAYVRAGGKFGKFGFIKGKPILVSPRRYEKEGRITTYLKYFLAGIYLFFLGNIKTNIFGYKLERSPSKKEKK